ncbi:hypothetical protein QQF64_024505 [Cirrhinus molitorella]|uniref:Uncharacterized protein n=1 Tax=Cirrhinus molitorella TaxID=172907 RepID=A0ABR3NLE0_9TELE
MPKRSLTIHNARQQTAFVFQRVLTSALVSRIPLALLVISEGGVMRGFWETKGRGEKERRMGKLRNVTRRSLWVPEIGGLPAAPGSVAPDGLAAMCCDCTVPLTPP